MRRHLIPMGILLALSATSAYAATAAKVVEVEVRETGGKLLFAPDRVEVAKGQVVRFVVHNGGAVAHEFVVGTKAANRAHAKMMAQMPGMKHHDADAIELDPGATGRLLRRFDHAGAFEFACLKPGHYEAGMHGEIVVR